MTPSPRPTSSCSPATVSLMVCSRRSRSRRRSSWGEIRPGEGLVRSREEHVAHEYSAGLGPVEAATGAGSTNVVSAINAVRAVRAVRAGGCGSFREEGADQVRVPASDKVAVDHVIVKQEGVMQEFNGGGDADGGLALT